MARRLALAVAFVGAASTATAAFAPVDVACGQAPLHTLTLACGGVCAANASCALQQPNASVPSGTCRMQCFQPLDASATSFTFYVALNASSNASSSDNFDRLNGSSAGTATDPAPSERVRRIGELALPTSVTNVTISGGDSAGRDRIVNLEIDASVFRSSPHVTTVAFVSMNLSGYAANISTLLPPKLQSLELRNTNMTQLPTSLDSLAGLRTLVLDMNAIVDVNSSVRMPNLTTVRLSDNSITSFSAGIPSLEFLDLTNNHLEAFPYNVLLSAPKLRSLRLAKNPAMKPAVFSTTQFAKLLSLEEFTVDRSALDHSVCLATQIRSLPSVAASVCVLSDSEWAARASGELTPHSKHDNSVLVVSLVAVIAVVGVLVAVYILWRRKSAAARGKSSTHTATADFERMYDDDAIHSRASIELSVVTPNTPSHLDAGGSSPRYRLSHDTDLLSHRIKNDLFEDVRVIGHGGFAVVWLVRLSPHKRLLASKRLVQDQATRQKTIEFIVEIKLNMQLVHPSIVEFVGVAWTTSEMDLQALFEYMPNGDLRAHLESTDVTRSPWGFEKLRIAIDIIEALVYVHSFSPPLVHCDLKSRNVLLADDMKAKLCDFGVSRFTSDTNVRVSSVGTGRWLAPEIVVGCTSYDESCDIYAFGVILSELDTHRNPYDDAEDSQGQRLPEAAVLQMVATGHLQPRLNDSCPEEIRQVAQHCLAFNPADRPTAIGVAYALRRLRNDWAKHKKLFRTA